MKESCDEKAVLIETLWNVKVEKAPPDAAAVMVLIETLWNVKMALIAFTQ